MVGVTTGGGFTLEMATRAKTQLILILAEFVKKDYADYQKHFQAAADKGLVELSTSANENESEDGSEDEGEEESEDESKDESTNESEDESEAQDERSISANENQTENENESESKCNPCA